MTSLGHAGHGCLLFKVGANSATRKDRQKLGFAAAAVKVSKAATGPDVGLTPFPDHLS